VAAPAGTDPALYEDPGAPCGVLPVLAKSLLIEVYQPLDEVSISVPDKLEGFAVPDSGRAFLVTDNDGRRRELRRDRLRRDRVVLT
jgi:hypothetical protein